jgi:excisionase family DNA binding protein
MELQTLIRPDQLAKTLKVSNACVYAWVERGLIPHYRIERCIRFDPEEIKAWLKLKKVEATRKPGGGPAPAC